MKTLITETFRDPPVLSTERLIFRRMLKSDSDDMYEYAKDPAVTRYLTWDSHPDRSYTRRYLGYISGKYRSGEFYDWALILKSENKMIGTCGFTRFDTQNISGEIGYVIARPYWDRGLATEAVKRIIDFGFSNLGLVRIEAKYMEANASSRRVMEKAGMTFEGIHRQSLWSRGRFVSVGVCSILREEADISDRR